MKKMHRILALMMALGMLLSLCACGGRELSFEERLQKAQEKANGMHSQHMDVEMQLSMEMSVLGKSESVDMTMTMSTDTQKEPNVTRLETNVTVLGTTQKILTYTEEVDGELWTYMSMDGGHSWQKQSAAKAGLGSTADPMQIMGLFVKSAKGFEKTGTETVNGSEASVYSGVLDSSYFQEILSMTGMESALTEAGENLGMEDFAEAFRDLGEIPMTIAIDDHSGRMVRYTMELTEAMQKLMQNIFDSVMGGNGVPGLSFTLKIGNCVATATMSQFDSVPEIQIPEAARQAEEVEAPTEAGVSQAFHF